MKIYLLTAALIINLLVLLLNPISVSAHSSGPAYPFALQAMSGSTAGTVDLMWMDDGSANQYDLTYGTSEGVYTWGVQDIKENPNMTTSFTVGGLTPGVTYHFMLIAEVSGTYASKSGPVSAIAKSGAVKAVTPAVSMPQAVAPTPQVVSKASSDQMLNQGPTSRYNFEVMTGQKTGSVDLEWMDDCQN